MTTATLHTSVQRSRFFQHALAAITGQSSSIFGLPLRSTQRTATPTASESASLEAQKVRNLAHTYSKTDPGFAADLYAAAARHEGLHHD